MDDFIASEDEDSDDDYYSRKKAKQLDDAPQNTFLMLVGPTGVGKSAIINSVCVYLL